jgi:ribose transport system permease protein
MMTSLRGAAYLLADGPTVLNNALNFAWVGNNNLGIVPWQVFFALIIIGMSWVFLRRTVIGTRIYAVGGNEKAAVFSGISVTAIILIVHGLSGLLSGLAGVVMGARLYSASGLLGVSYELDAIAAVILGGTSFNGGIGGVGGTLVGALIISVLNNGLIIIAVPYFWQQVIKGIVIIVAVIIDIYRQRVKVK